MCSTFGTVICPIRGLCSRLVISDRCKVINYPNRVLNKSCRPLAGAEGQWAELGRKLRQTYLLTPLFATVTWPYNPGSVEPFSLLPRIGPYNPGARAPLFPERRWYSRPHLSSPLRRGPFRVIWALRPQRPLPTGTSVPGARAPSLALIADGIYAPTSATLLPFALVKAGLYDPSPAPSQPILLYHVLRPITAGAHRALYL